MVESLGEKIFLNQGFVGHHLTLQQMVSMVERTGEGYAGLFVALFAEVEWMEAMQKK